MSEEPKKEEMAHHAKWLKGPQGMEAIPVGTAQFARVLDFPGMATKDRLAEVSTGQINVRRVRMYFLPWMRHLMVSVFDPSELKPNAPHPTMVSESVCTWTPK